MQQAGVEVEMLVNNAGMSSRATVADSDSAAASKAYVLSFTKPCGVKVVAVSRGPTQTSMNS